MKTAMQELIFRIQYSIDKQNGVSLTETQVNTLTGIMLVAENLLEEERKQIQKAFSDGQETSLSHLRLPIELPSDDEAINHLSKINKDVIEFDNGFILGAKWMKQQILNQNK